jgi:hypothetical protein
MADQNSYTPSQSTALGGFAGALAFIVVYVLGLFKVPVTPEFASAVTVLVTAGVAYLGNGGKSAHTIKEDVNQPSGV